MAEMGGRREGYKKKGDGIRDEGKIKGTAEKV